MRSLTLSLVFLVSLAASAAEVPVAPLDVAPEPTPYYRAEPVNVVAGESAYVVSWTELYFSADSPYGTGAFRIFDASGHPTMLALSLISRNHTFAPAGDAEFVVAEGTRWITHPPPSPLPAVFVSWVELDGRHLQRYTITKGQSETTTGPAAATHDHALVTYYFGYTQQQPHLALILRDGTIVRDWQRTVAPLAIVPSGSGFLLFTPDAIIPVSSGGEEGAPIPAGPFANLKVAAHGDQIGAVWTAGDHTYAAIFRGDGTLAEQSEISNGIAPSLVAWSGGRFRTLLNNCAVFFGGGSTATNCGPLGLGGTFAGTATTNVVARLVNGQVWTATGPIGGVPVSEGVIASEMVRAQVNPAASGETLVWSERPAGGGLMQVVVNGQPIAPGASADQITPRIAGSLVVWNEGGTIRALHLDDPAHQVLTLGNGIDPDVATDGIASLVVWRSPNYDHPLILGTGVTRSGTITQPGGALVAPSDSNQYRPVVAAASPGRFLVLWLETVNITGLGPRELIIDDIVDTNVLRLTDPKIVVNRVATQYGSAQPPYELAANEIACNGTSCIATWLEGSPNTYLSAAIDPSDATASATRNAIATGVTLTGRTSLIPSDAGFVLGWPSGDVRITTLDAAGVLLETHRIGGTNVNDLALISEDKVLYSRVVDVLGGPRRVFIRTAPPPHRRAM